MKRFMLFFVLCSTLLIACEPITPNGDKYPVVSADDYYWYKGNKIYLERGNQEYIIYDDLFTFGIPRAPWRPLLFELQLH